MASQNHRDAVRLRNLAQEVIRQVGFYLRNTAQGSDDDIRFLLMETESRKMTRVAGTAARRWKRQYEVRKAKEGRNETH